MSLLPAIHATIEISKVMIPPIVIGFFIASVIRSSPYFRYLSLPTARLASIANLSQECSAALTLFLVNNWAALAALSEVHKRKSITDNELIVAVLVGFIPRGFHGTIFFSVPVAFSVLGIRAGGLYVILDFLANFFIAVAGILAGRLMLKPITMAMIEDENVSTSERWTEIIKQGILDSISSSKKIIKILVPTIFLAQLAIDYVLVLPIVERYNALIEPVGFSSSSLIVLLASVVSQSAAIVACGTLLKNGSISIVGCLLLLFMARFLHMGIGCMRIGIPANVSYFGGRVGLRVTAVEYLLVELANVTMIIILLNIFLNDGRY